MKYLFLFLVLTAAVAASSITYEQTTIPIERYTISNNRITIERFCDEYTTALYKEVTTGEKHVALQLEDKTVMTFGGARFTELQTTATTDERARETVTILYQEVTTANNTSCAKDICEYLQNEMGVTVSSAASFLPFSNAVVNVQTTTLKNVGTITIKDSNVESMTCCMESLKPTHILTIKGLSTLQDIHTATDQTKAFKDKLDNEELGLSATTLGGKISLFFKRLLIRFL